MYAVILAGGGGTRLWPLSRPDFPKPFLPLLGRETLLQRTLARLYPLIDMSDAYVVTDRRYTTLVAKQLPGLGGVIAEPQGRNTAAAIALATLAIKRREDEVMIVLPADHTIEREDVFRGVLTSAARSLATGAFGVADPLVTLGVHVDRPATEYGYLMPDLDRAAVVDGLQAYPLRAFEEKPDAARAEELRRQPGVAWNAGMFLWRRRAIREALGRYTRLIAALTPAIASDEALATAYEGLPSISIDYAVMEPAARDGLVVMAGMNVGWGDLGGWTALLHDIGAAGTGRVIPSGEPVEVGPDDLLVHGSGPSLAISAGPSGTIRFDGPAALLTGAARHRRRIEDLLKRVAEREAQST